MGVSKNRGFSSQIIHFSRVFPYKPSILGYHYFWKLGQKKPKIDTPYSKRILGSQPLRKKTHNPRCTVSPDGTGPHHNFLGAELVNTRPFKLHNQQVQWKMPHPPKASLPFKYSHFPLNHDCGRKSIIIKNEFQRNLMFFFTEWLVNGGPYLMNHAYAWFIKIIKGLSYVVEVLVG